MHKQCGACADHEISSERDRVGNVCADHEISSVRAHTCATRRRLFP
jgi:hypothetical protein